jgi:iron(II)-dependent oxidoreductase
MLGPIEARGYIAEVRGRVLDHLERTALDPARPLVRDGFVYGMVVQHEHQHDETLLATANLMSDYSRFATVATPAPASAIAPPSGEVLVQAGPFTMGTDTIAWAYDNERGAHTVDLPSFWIDAAPVTNAHYLRFVEDGGYHDARHWTPEGWKWRTRAGAEHPEFWRRDGEGSWSVLRFGAPRPLNLEQPVQHVSWFEADAFARWAGKRLPTEAEWEKAASWEPAGAKRIYPWGDDEPSERTANLGQRHYEPAAAGAYPDGVSPWGCHQMLGDVWEWTSSDFLPYPGFASFPYVEYSEVFFGSSYKVLRGGSWATHPAAIRTTFRNWDYPIRRQIFAGFRCARDA